jgi:hypothetical protein
MIGAVNPADDRSLWVCEWKTDCGSDAPTPAPSTPAPSTPATPAPTLDTQGCECKCNQQAGAAAAAKPAWSTWLNGN